MTFIKRAKRAVWLLLTLCLIIATTAGCGSKASSFDRKAIEAAVGEVIARYERGIEEYNISESGGALSCFEPNGFMLTISDYKRAYHKGYDYLKVELEEDAGRQRRLRKDYGYEIDLQLGPALFTGITRTRAHVSQPFSVYEASSTRPRHLTGSGTITWEFVKVEKGWRALRLTIYDSRFDP